METSSEHTIQEPKENDFESFDQEKLVCKGCGQALIKEDKFCIFCRTPVLNHSLTN